MMQVFQKKMIFSIMTYANFLFRNISKYKKILLIIFLPLITIFSCHRFYTYPVNFYGLVVDQYNQPIPGVTITATVGRGSPIVKPAMFLFRFDDRTIHKKTNKNGQFAFKNYSGLGIQFPPWYQYPAFHKTGYEFVPNETPVRFGISDLASHSANTPFVYVMRKLGKRTYLIDGNHIGNIGRSIRFEFPRGNSIFFGFDIMKKTEFGPAATLGNLKDQYTKDLVISGKWDESKNAWAITFAPGAESGGIQILNKKLFAAPIDGYQSSVTFYAKNSYKGHPSENIYLLESPHEPLEPERIGKTEEYNHYYYLYLKSKSCELYSRITLSGLRTNINGSFLGFDYYVTTNPYAGQRSLELEPNISYELKKALDKEIKEAFAKDPNAIIPPPTPEMFKMPDSQIPQIMAERQRLISK